MDKDLINRITYHLSSGGLFNPELADHLAVRNLLMECREALAHRKPLTDEQIEAISAEIERSDFFDCVVPFARAIEAAHGIGDKA